MASADGNATPAKDEQMSSAPSLCASGCGFFGNPATGGMCSKCFKESCAKQSAASAPAASAPAASEAKAAPPPEVKPAAAPPPAPATAAEIAATTKPAEPQQAAAAAASSSAAAVVEEPMPDVSDAPSSSSKAVVRAAEEKPEDEPPKKVQTNTSRCWTCNRKIGLLGFQCKCEYYFCAEHRYSDRHQCSFDFKEQGKKQLKELNPVIAPSKMESIN